MIYLVSLFIVLVFASPCLAKQEKQEPDTWRFPATVTRIIDGDTIVADVELGMKTIRKAVHVRLLGYNAPEMSTADGPAWKARLTAFLAPPCTSIELVAVRGKELDSFGRLLAYAYCGDIDVAAQMIVTASP